MSSPQDQANLAALAFQKAQQDAQRKALETGQSQTLTQEKIEAAKQEIRASNQNTSNQDQRDQVQAQQKVAAEAFQDTKRQAEQRAIATGTPQEITKEDVAAREQELITTKYSGGVPIVRPSETSRVLGENYASYQNQNLNLQRQAIAQQKQDQRAKAVDAAYQSGQGAPDFAMMVPASGFRKANVAEGYGAFGEKQTTIFRLEPIKPAEAREYFVPNPTNPFDIREGAPPESTLKVDLGMPKPKNDIFTEFGLGIRDTAEGYANLVTGKPSSYNVASKAQSAIFRESDIAREKGVVGFDIDTEGLSKVIGEAAKNPARAIGQVYGDITIGLFGAEGAGKAVGAGVKGIGKIADVVKDSGIGQRLTNSIESSAVVIRNNAVKFVNPDIAPDLSGFKSVKMDLGRSLVTTRPLVQKAYAEPFQNTSVNLGVGSARQTPLKPFQNVTIDLGTTRASGIAEKGIKPNVPRPIKPEDFGFKETKGSDGTTQLVRQVTEQATKQEVKTTPVKLFQNTSLSLGVGAVTTSKTIQKAAGSSIRQNAGILPAFSSQSNSDVSKLLGLGGQTGASRKKQAAGSVSDFGFDISAVPTSKQSPFPISQSGLIGQSGQSFKTDLGSLFGTSSKTTPGFNFQTPPLLTPKQTPFQGLKTPNPFKFDIPSATTIDIPTPKPPKIPSLTTEPPFRDLLDIPPPSKKKKTKQGRKKGGKAQKRTFFVTNPLSAVIGVDTSIGKAIQRFGDLT